MRDAEAELRGAKRPLVIFGKGAAYAVAVKQPDGDIAEVRLDRRDRLIGIDSVQSSQDSGDGGD